MSSPYAREIEVARAAALAAGEAIARHAQGDRKSWNKSEDSPVTHADLEANREILSRLKEAFPADAILSEETADSSERLKQSRVWIVDPLDGTKEFIAGIPEYAVSIALSVDGQPELGIVYQPQTRECFWAAAGVGAYLNDTPIRVSNAQRLEDCAMLSSRTEMSRGQVEELRDWFTELRPVGSVALKLAHTAAARGDVWISMAPKSEWDVCGGHAIVREAGGTFLELDRGERVYNQRDILLQPVMAAGPKQLVEEIRTRRQA